MSGALTKFPAATKEEIECALGFVPNHDRDVWLRMGMAVRSELGDDGFDVWDGWSQSATNYNEADARSAWKSFNGDGVTIASLFGEANKHGYQPRSRELTTQETAHREAERNRRHAEAEKQRQDAAKQQAVAKADMQRQWESATPEDGTHRYLRDKGVQAHGVRTDGYKLLVAVSDAQGDLHGLQRIRPNGDKKFKDGSNISGNYYALGKPDGRLVVAEGFATAASIHEATDLAFAVAFI